MYKTDYAMLERQLQSLLDVDSPVLNRFAPEDAQGLGGVVEILMNSCHWPQTS